MDTVTHVPELLSARKSHPFTFPGGFLKDFFFYSAGELCGMTEHAVYFLANGQLTS